jgi:predicted DNA-binding transcriptional regulator AlpA
VSIDFVVTPALITAAELAEMLNVSLRTLWRWRSGRKVPEPVQLGGVVRWRLDEIRKWIADGCQMSGDRK